MLTFLSLCLFFYIAFLKLVLFDGSYFMIGGYSSAMEMFSFIYFFPRALDKLNLTSRFEYI